MHGPLNVKLLGTLNYDVLFSRIIPDIPSYHGIHKEGRQAITKQQTGEGNREEGRSKGKRAKTQSKKGR
jgi:hypothetical protein